MASLKDSMATKAELTDVREVVVEIRAQQTVQAKDIEILKDGLKEIKDIVEKMAAKIK